MANKKIRLTYLWADESVMQKDFAKGVSARMTEWAQEFYARYELGVDVDPPFDYRRLKSVARLAKYALVKNGGLSPDFNLDAKLDEEEKKRRKAIEDEALKEGKRLEALKKIKEKELSDAERQRDDLERERSQLPANDTFNRGRLDGLIRQADNRILALIGQAGDLEIAIIQATGMTKYNKIEALDDEIERRKAEGNAEMTFRFQMAQTFLKHGIGSDKRLNVIFCEIQKPPGDKESGREFASIGATLSLTDRIWLWPYAFVVVDLGGQRRTVAHELIHGAGPHHPGPAAVAKIAERWFQTPPRRTTGSIFDAPLKLSPDPKELQKHLETIPGGYFDGDYNDIMNYTLEDKEPKDYVLHPSDQGFLEAAPFVGP